MTIPVLSVLFGIAWTTPSWHWVVGFIALVSSGLAYLWITHWIATQRPGYKEGPAGGLGIILIGNWTIAFFIAAGLFIAGLIWWHSKD